MIVSNPKALIDDLKTGEPAEMVNKPDGLINETAERIASVLKTNHLCAAEGEQRIAIQVIVSELTSFIASIRLAAKSKNVSTPDPFIVQLIEEARRVSREIKAKGLDKSWPASAFVWKQLLGLANALEQQVAARGEAETALTEANARCNRICRNVHRLLTFHGAPKAGSAEARKAYPENIAYLSYDKRLALLMDGLKERIVKVEQMNAVLKYGWLALCGLRESYIIALKTLEQIVNGRIDANQREMAKAALASMIDPPPENVKYQGTFAWALAQRNAGHSVNRKGDKLAYLWADGFGAALAAEDYKATDWQLAKDTPTGESEDAEESRLGPFKAWTDGDRD